MKNNIRSPALKDFWVSLREVGTIMSLFEVNETAVKKKPINESLSRAALVLLCSHVENFFESLIIDILTFHEFNQTSISQLPERLRVTQILKSPDLLDKPYSGNKWKLIDKIRGSKFMNDHEKCTSGDFDSELCIKGFASPGSKEIENLFKGVGIEDVWISGTQGSSAMQLKNSINAFVARRNGIAHGSSSDKPTPSDIKGFVKDICKLVRHFNKIAAEYLIHEFSPSSLWGVVC
jgi:RiboL-PSP-HEPN